MATTTIEIFRAGRHTDASGETFTFSEADLARIADAYDSAAHEAPLVVGHPRDNAPAYGWTKALLAEGKRLRAVVGDVDASFAEGALRTKRYKKVSASFYKPAARGNPKPEGYYLRHIGVLGAQPPAVKGLRDASFRERASDVVTVDFEEAGDAAQEAAEAAIDATSAGEPSAEAAFSAAQLEVLKKLIAEAIGAAADATTGAAAADAGTADHAEAADVVAALEKVEGLTPEQLDALKKHIALAFEEAAKAESSGDAAAASTTVDASEASEVRRLCAEIAAHKASTRAKERTARIDGLVQAGILTPAQRKAALSFAELVDGDVANFAEGDTRPRSQILCDDLLAKFPQQVVTREVSRSDAADFGEDESAKELAARAEAYRAEQRRLGIHISTTEAVMAVSKKG